jgi:hypothetical protein
MKEELQQSLGSSNDEELQRRTSQGHWKTPEDIAKHQRLQGGLNGSREVAEGWWKLGRVAEHR